MLATSKQRSYCVLRSHLLRGHNCREVAVDHKLKLNRIAWGQRIGDPTTYAHRVRLRNLPAYRRIEILESSCPQNEAKNQYFQQRFEQYRSNKTSDSFRTWFYFVH